MARIAGINIPVEKHIVIGLTSIFGVGINVAKKICKEVSVNPAAKVKDLTESELEVLRSEVVKYKVEGDLRREIAMNIKRLMELGAYRGQSKSKVK